MMTRATRLAAALMALAAPLPALAAPIPALLYKNPQCGCCEGYADYLRQNGFTVEVKPSNDLASISQKAGVPEALEGCHTMFVGGYVVDGHVPVAAVKRLLAEKPALKGITLPGMPMGSPGMGGDKAAPLTTYAIPKDGSPPRVFDVE